MKLFPWLGALALGLMTLASPAGAQTTASSVQFPAGYAPGYSPCIKQGDGTCVPVSTTAGFPSDTVIRATATDRGAPVGTSSTQLMAANTARRGFSIQNQGSGACYISGLATATADYHSLRIDAGSYYETSPTHVGTGAIAAICAVAATPLYSREW